MKLELYFTTEEMCDFLIKKDYTVEQIKTWSSHNTYHNQVENSYKNVYVAYKNTFDVFNDVDGAYRDLSVEKFKVENVFIKEMKEKLLIM